MTPTDSSTPAAITDRQAREALDQIHAAMCVPFSWSADTHDAVADVLTKMGYGFPDEPTANAIAVILDAEPVSTWQERKLAETAGWRPEVHPCTPIPRAEAEALDA